MILSPLVLCRFVCDRRLPEVHENEASSFFVESIGIKHLFESFVGKT